MTTQERAHACQQELCDVTMTQEEIAVISKHISAALSERQIDERKALSDLVACIDRSEAARISYRKQHSKESIHELLCACKQYERVTNAARALLAKEVE